MYITDQSLMSHEQFVLSFISTLQEIFGSLGNVCEQFVTQISSQQPHIKRRNQKFQELTDSAYPIDFDLKTIEQSIDGYNRVQFEPKYDFESFLQLQRNKILRIDPNISEYEIRDFAMTKWKYLPTAKTPKYLKDQPKENKKSKKQEKEQEEKQKQQIKKQMYNDRFQKLLKNKKKQKTCKIRQKEKQIKVEDQKQGKNKTIINQTVKEEDLYQKLKRPNNGKQIIANRLQKIMQKYGYEESQP